VAAKENRNILIGPEEGSFLPILGITHKVTAESFGGALTIIEASIPPGDMIPPHTHTREDECAFVLEGGCLSNRLRVGEVLGSAPGQKVQKIRNLRDVSLLGGG
jgi:quercetin dioxygenase-like cupin family protein